MVENERKDDNTGDSGGKSPKKLRVLLRTFGCQMNDRDSEALAGMFIDRGYALVDDARQADIILVNTCSVRDHAENRAISLVGSLKKLTAANTRKKRVIGVIGCMAQRRGQEILAAMAHVNLVCGPAAIERILDYVEDILKDDSLRIIDIQPRCRQEKIYQSQFRVEQEHGQVVISVGCSNFCSYCVVPYVRGTLQLRRPEDIIAEVKRNVALGIKHITLLGQNVNDYEYHGVTINGEEKLVSFIDLLKMVEAEKGVEEITFISSNPRNTSRQLFELMACSSKIKKHLHLPFQSGSDRVLALMKRGYTRNYYLQLAKDYYHIVGGTLSTDVIVGFPTESEDDFEQTINLIKQLKFRFAYIFKYSPRLQTIASQLLDDIPTAVKDKRHALLLALQKKISLAHRKL